MCPQATVILGHMGGFYHCQAAIQAAQDLPNVLLDTSAMPYPEMIRRAVETIGAERVLFGSDGPGCVPVRLHHQADGDHAANCYEKKVRQEVQANPWR